MISAKVGLYYTTTSGFTKEAAGIIHDEFSKRGVISEPIEVDASSALNSFRDFSALLVGTPTWNTGAEEMRSGTTWDNILEEVRSENLQGKKSCCIWLWR
jgi:flavodoxin I